MKDLQFEQIAKKLLEFDKRLTAIEEWLTSFTPFRSLGINDTLDPLYIDAEKLVKQHDYASASLIQRRLTIGYARAARILDQLSEKGIISSGSGSKPRKVLIKQET